MNILCYFEWAQQLKFVTRFFSSCMAAEESLGMLFLLKLKLLPFLKFSQVELLLLFPFKTVDIKTRKLYYNITFLASGRRPDTVSIDMDLPVGMINKWWLQREDIRYE